MSIDWNSLDLKKMASDEKRQLSGVCHKLNKFDNFLIQFVLIVFMAHQLAIIYNAERAIDLASITNKCNGAPATDIKSQCQIAVWAARVGFGLAALMLLLVRSLDSMSLKSSAIIQMIFGITILVSFIVSLSCSAIAKGKTANCTATQPPNQVGNPLEELNTALGYMVNWSAVGMSAGILYIVYYSLRAFMPGSAKSAGELSTELSAESGSSTPSS